MNETLDLKNLDDYELGELYKKLYFEKVKIEGKIALAREETIRRYKEEGIEDFKSISITPIAGTRRVQWKALANELNPPDELIEKHTAVSAPSYRFNILSEDEIQSEGNKFI